MCSAPTCRALTSSTCNRSTAKAAGGRFLFCLALFFDFDYNKKMISTIAFDYNGVIELNGFDVRQKIIDILGVTRQEWSEVYTSMNHLSNVENMESRDLLVEVSRKLNATPEQIEKIRELIIESENSKTLNFGILEIIKFLKSLDYNIALISNYTTSLRDKLIKQKILDLFDEVIISAEVGYQKPNKEIFEVLLGRLNIKSEELVFIDDTQNSLKYSGEIGYVPVLFTSNEKLKIEIESILGISIIV